MPQAMTASGSASRPNGITTSDNNPNGMMIAETSGAARRLPSSE